LYQIDSRLEALEKAVQTAAGETQAAWTLEEQAAWVEDRFVADELLLEPGSNMVTARTINLSPAYVEENRRAAEWLNQATAGYPGLLIPVRPASVRALAAELDDGRATLWPLPADSPDGFFIIWEGGDKEGGEYAIKRWCQSKGLAYPRTEDQAIAVLKDVLAAAAKARVLLLWEGESWAV